MRPSNKPRNRNKNNNNRRNSNPGNVVNRVFDSSGPEGKVRGTPQQIIDKYQTLARDAQLAGDRIGAENYLQHSEHYSRLLGAAQREMNERREAAEANRAQRQSQQQNEQPAATGSDDEQPSMPETNKPLFVGEGDQPDLVATPETGDDASKPERPARTKRPRKPKEPQATIEAEADQPTVSE